MHNRHMSYTLRDRIQAFPGLVRDVWAARPRGWQLFSLLAMTAMLMGVALGAADPAELQQLSVGNWLGAKSVSAFLLIGSALLGVCLGIVDTTGKRCIAETLPGSPIAISIRSLLRRLVRTIVSWWLCASTFLLRAGASVAHSPVRRDLPRLSTADLWPAGDSPRLVYES